MLPTRRIFDRRAPKSLRSVSLIVPSGLGGLTVTSTSSPALDPTPSATLASHVTAANGDIAEVRTQQFGDYCL